MAFLIYKVKKGYLGMNLGVFLTSQLKAPRRADATSAAPRVAQSLIS
jgi:hypothetical protein